VIAISRIKPRMLRRKIAAKASAILTDAVGDAPDAAWF
jgi:hypothetical protein